MAALWPMVVLVLGAGLIAVTWRAIDRLSTSELRKELAAFGRRLDAADAEKVDWFVAADARLKHLEAMVPESMDAETAARMRMRRTG